VRLRFFFDTRSGVCFWSADAAAGARFGNYPVTLDRLDLPPALVQAGEALMTRYDACIDWNDPGGASLWSDAERTAFRRDASAFLDAVRAARPDIGFEDART